MCPSAHKTCKECGDSFLILSRHVRSKHGMAFEEYVVKHEHGGDRPTCACGCGENVAFRKGAFKRFKHCHAVLVPEIRAAMVEAGRAAACDPEKLKKTSDALKLKWQDPSFRARVHSPENNIKRIEASRLATTTPEFCEKMSKLKLALWNDEGWSQHQREMMKGESFSSNVSLATSKALSSPEKKELMSKRARDAFLSGKRKPKSRWKTVKSGYRIDPNGTGKEIWFDSGWEHEFMCSAISAGRKCIREPLIIEYKNELGKQSTYFPDFLVDEKYLVEIKGQLMPADELKFAAAEDFVRKHGMTFSVLNKRNFDAFIESIAR